MTTDLPKLYMLLIGSKAPGRHVEQHDFFFGIANSLKDLVPDIKAFWREAGSSIHIDGWREVNSVDGFDIKVVPKAEAANHTPEKLFFIFLGGYQANKLEEQHYTVLTVQTDRAQAIQHAKKTVFFKSNTIAKVKGANAHIDDKYGIDVDDIYNIEEMLTPAHKNNYHIQITPSANLPDDEIHLGYFKLDKLP
ncbi:hypothetical protein A0256_07615 [Mucilaginibacter sp. PAMC 26640]|nr:hypothetical protein A0256_07615 [Mucilaginibacter sp. PAMC 26640]